MSDDDAYEAGYIHGAAFARLSIAIAAVGEAMTFVEDDAALREALRIMVAERDDLARGR